MLEESVSLLDGIDLAGKLVSVLVHSSLEVEVPGHELFQTSFNRPESTVSPSQHVQGGNVDAITSVYS